MMSGKGGGVGAGWRAPFLPSFPGHLFQAQHGGSQGSSDLFHSGRFSLPCCPATERERAHSLLPQSLAQLRTWEPLSSSKWFRFRALRSLNPKTGPSCDLETER